MNKNKYILYFISWILEELLWVNDQFLKIYFFRFLKYNFIMIQNTLN